MDYLKKTNKIISDNIDENFKLIETYLDTSKNFDIRYRELEIKNKKIIMFYVNSLISSEQIVEINNTIIRSSNLENCNDLYKIIYNNTFLIIAQYTLEIKLLNLILFCNPSLTSFLFFDTLRQ